MGTIGNGSTHVVTPSLSIVMATGFVITEPHAREAHESSDGETTPTHFVQVSRVNGGRHHEL